MAEQQESFYTTTSPARKTRIQEKEELAYLNDRFMSYIEQVRTLKESNVRLEVALQSTKEELGKESESVKTLYEAELADARNLIDETAKEKARQQILASKHGARCDELDAELRDVKKDLETLEARLAAAERNAASYDAQRKAIQGEKSKFQKKAKDLEEELEDLRNQFEAMKDQLEAETLSKVDLQNNLQSLKEELAFKKKIYDEEIDSVRSKTVVHTTGVLETDFEAQLDSRLETAIDELREKSELEIQDYKAQMERAYGDKIEALEKQTARDASTIGRLSTEIRKINSSVDSYKVEITKLQKVNDKREAELRDKEDELSRLRQRHSDEVSRYLEELREARANYERKMQEYEQLMDVKVELDQEIATYRALLQEEENRLNLTPTPREKRSRARTQTQTEQVTKKPRLDPDLSQQQSSSASGYIQVCDVDPTGRYIQIKNLSDSIESLGSFRIVHQVDNNKEVTFKFHGKSKLQGGAAVTVWGSQAEGAVHNPPTDIIWRNTPTWGAGKKSVTKLVSKASEVLATYTQHTETTPSKSQSSVPLESIDSKASRSFPHIPDNDDDMEQDSAHSSSGTGSGQTRVTRTTTTTTTRFSSGGRGGAGEGSSGGQQQQQQQQQQQVGDEHMFHQKGDPSGADKANCIIS